MKNSSLFGILLIMVSFISFAQKPTKVTIKHSFFQTPKHRLSQDRTISKQVILSYKEKNNFITEQNEKLNKERQKNAEQDKKNYENKTTSSKIAERVILGEKKPSGTATHIKKGYTQKEWSDSYVLDKGCKTIGLELSNSAKAKIVITVLPISIEYKNNYVESATLKDGSTRPAYYTYSLSGSAGIKIEAFNETGELVITKNFNHWDHIESSKFSSSNSRNNDYKQNEHSKKRALEEKIMKTDLKKSQEYIKNNFDYVSVERKSIIHGVKDKKGDYKDLNTCSDKFTKVIQYYSMENTIPKGLEQMKELIPVYEKEISQFDPENKKGKINSNLAQALYINLAQVYVWSYEYEKALNCIIEHNIIDSKKNKKEIKKLNDFIEDQQSRFKD